MRKPKWEQLFVEWLESVQRQEFEWGQNDCALMCAGCVETITGKHPAPELIGAYYTPLGAYRVLLERGGLSGICDSTLGERIGPAFARRGDVILCQYGQKETLGVCCGTQILIAGDVRPLLVNRKDFKELNAWRVE